MIDWAVVWTDLSLSLVLVPVAHGLWWLWSTRPKKKPAPIEITFPKLAAVSKLYKEDGQWRAEIPTGWFALEYRHTRDLTRQGFVYDLAEQGKWLVSDYLLRKININMDILEDGPGKVARSCDEHLTNAIAVLQKEYPHIPTQLILNTALCMKETNLRKVAEYLNKQEQLRDLQKLQHEMLQLYVQPTWVVDPNAIQTPLDNRPGGFIRIFKGGGAKGKSVSYPVPEYKQISAPCTYKEALKLAKGMGLMKVDE